MTIDVHPGSRSRPEAAARGVLSRRRLLVGTVLGSGAAYALSACGMTEPGATGGENGGGGGGDRTLVAAFDREIISLDPHGPSDVDEGTLLACRHIYDTLVVRQEDGFAPALATEWQQVDELTWEFTLREGVRFHDGSELTAEDVKASLERLAASDTPQAALWPTLDEVLADGRTVRISTTDPLGTMLANLTLMFVAPAGKLDQEGFFNSPIGSGPFSVDSFTPSDHVHLIAYPDYWGTKPKLQRLELPYIPETATRMTSIKTGEVDLTWSIPPDQLESLEGSDGVRIEKTDSVVYYFNWFNCSRKPFTDPRVRQAMWHAIDVPTVVETLFPGGTATVATAPIPSTVFGHAEQQPYAYDPDRAKALLAEAGLADGFDTHVMWSAGIAPQIRSVAQSFAGYWSKIGVKVELQELEQASWLTRLTELDWDMDLQNNAGTTGDADYILGRLYTSEANRMAYKNSELDDILAKARAETDQDKRAELYAAACKIIWDDAVGIFPMELSATYASRSSVQGFVPAPNNQPILSQVTA
jgi:peptide/nickel transport system substrate-binding protein